MKKKALVLFTSAIIMAALVLAVSPLILAVDNDPSISISQEDAGNGNYKLVVTATASSEIGTIISANIAISFDNTVIAPVDANTGAIITATLVNQKEPFKTVLNNGLNQPLWQTKGTRTIFDITAKQDSGRDMSAGVVVFEFYFTLQSGKTTDDMNSNTFILVVGPTAHTHSAQLGTKNAVFYRIDNTQGDDSLTLTSFIYTNSTVKPTIPEVEVIEDTTSTSTTNNTGSGTSTVEQPPATGNTAIITDETTPTAVSSAYQPMPPLHSAGTKVEATKTNNALILNEQETIFPAVKIAGYNWLKLRDFAMLLNETPKWFAVYYDEETNIIDIVTGVSYQPLGDEGTDKLAEIETGVSSPQKLRVNGEFIDIAAYNIQGYNYFRLRDLAIILNFAVIYDDGNGQIELDFDNPYQE